MIFDKFLLLGGNLLGEGERRSLSPFGMPACGGEMLLPRRQVSFFHRRWASRTEWGIFHRAISSSDFYQNLGKILSLSDKTRYIKKFVLHVLWAIIPCKYKPSLKVPASPGDVSESGINPPFHFIAVCDFIAKCTHPSNLQIWHIIFNNSQIFIIHFEIKLPGISSLTS